MANAVHIKLPPLTRSRTNDDGYLAVARDRLGDVAFADAWAAGRATPRADAIAGALDGAPLPPGR